MTENTERHIGPYQLVGLLGRGGSSAVYEAIDERDGHVVALKVVTAASDAVEDDTMLRRLERSSLAMASLDHPNIAHVYESGEAPLSNAPADAPHARYIAMERVEGMTLRERLKREGGLLPLAVAADILEQTARGLDAVHAAGVIHRDIKPSNILVGTTGIVKLTDFGIARRANDTMVTIEGVMIGSPNYISPEQTNNQPATSASDLWSLGVVLYEMVVGNVPFAGENIPVTLYQVAHSDLPTLPPHLPLPVRNVLTRALDRDPARRFPTALGLAQAFRRAIAPAVAAAAILPSETVQTVPAELEPIRYSTTKKRSFAPLALAMIGGAALVAGGFLAAPRMTATANQGQSQNTSVVSDMEKLPVTPAVTASPSPAPKATPVPRAARVATVTVRATPSLTPAPSPVVESTQSPVRALPSPAPSPQRSPSPPALVVTERTPAPTSTPRVRRRRDIPAIVVAARPPVEVPRDLPPQDMEPLPKATPKATPEVTPRPTPSPPPTPSPTPVPPPGPAPRAVVRAPDSDRDEEEGVEDVDPNTRLSGTWRGIHTGHTARLVLRAPNPDTGEFRGTLTVQMPSGPVRIAVAGQVFDDGGITMRETRVIQALEVRAWDLGTNTGTFDPDDLKLSGQGRDKRGRTYQWSFQRQ